MKPRKPCIHCYHKKGAHFWNPNFVAGGQGISHPTYPCQEEGCDCNDYQEGVNSR